MILITIKHKGNFANTESFLGRVSNFRRLYLLEKYGQEGVSALASATPIDTGKTAEAWSYKITETPGRIKISWMNSNIVDGVPIAVLIQYGHGTRNGGYVQGKDYINPAMRPIFDKIARDVWREVTK